VSVFAASCVGYDSDWLNAAGPHDFWNSLGKGNSWQHLAFQDSPRIKSSMMKDFVDLLAQGQPNYSAWIDSQYRYSKSKYNQPIVFTIRNASADAGYPADYLGTRHEHANLLTGLHLPPVAPSTFGRSVTYSSSMDDDDGDPFVDDVNDDPEPTDCIDYLGNPSPGGDPDTGGE